MGLVQFAVAGLLAQSLVGLPFQHNEVKSKQTVVYEAEAQTIPAGKQTPLPVRFTVVDGFHVNSHTPRSDFLLPTVLKVQGGSGAKLGQPIYPAGHDYSFSFSPQDKLDVYSGSFVVLLPVLATKGQHTVSATLHYQACDHAACYPPKILPIQIPFTAK